MNMALEKLNIKIIDSEAPENCRLVAEENFPYALIINRGISDEDICGA